MKTLIAFVFVSVALITFSVSADQERNFVQTFHALCVEPNGDYDKMVALADSLELKRLPDDVSKGMSAENAIDHRACGTKKDGVYKIFGFARNSGCGFVT